MEHEHKQKLRDGHGKFYPLVRWLNRITSPEGCTAVDARKLREYNHGMGIENGELRKALHDAIDKPKGVVPDSALKFYAPNVTGEAEEKEI